MWQPRSPGERLPKGTGENHKEGRFKLERGDGKEGRPDLSEVGGYPTCHPGWHSPSIKTSRKAPFLNPDPLMNWSGPENIAWVKINDEGSWALLDSGSTINAVTPEFIKAHSLDVGPYSNLLDGTLKINGFGGLFSWPLGYVIIRVQVEGLKGHNKDQVALVILDQTTFGSRVLVTIGTPTINWVMNVIKESEIDELSVSLNGLRISHLLAGCQGELSLKNNKTTSPIPDPTDFNEAVKAMKWEEIKAFSSKIVHGCTKTVLLGNNMYVMTQAPRKGWGALFAPWPKCGEHLHRDDYRE